MAKSVLKTELLNAIEIKCILNFNKAEEKKYRNIIRLHTTFNCNDRVKDLVKSDCTIPFKKIKFVKITIDKDTSEEFIGFMTLINAMKKKYKVKVSEREQDFKITMSFKAYEKLVNLNKRSHVIKDADEKIVKVLKVFDNVTSTSICDKNKKVIAKVL